MPGGRENKSDSPSSGERTGSSPNRRCSGIGGVVGLRDTKLQVSGTVLESTAVAGDSPLHEV